MKRLFDIVCSLFGLTILCPLFVIVALWIVLDSPGGVFYRQIRVGRYGKDFRIFKFRSMFTDSDRRGLITVGDRDPRITRAGYWIRKYKIDELPQLINVLIGDMSFVGPRPEVRKYVDLYDEQQRHVLDIRPGITDAASIKYRNENEILATQADPDRYYVKVIMPDKLRINLDYINHHSLGRDIRLIFETFLAI